MTHRTRIVSAVRKAAFALAIAATMSAASAADAGFAGVQWQVLSYLGTGWGQSDCRFSDDQLKSWLAEATARGGAVTLDVHIDCPGGRIPAAQVAQFARCRPGKKADD